MDQEHNSTIGLITHRTAQNKQLAISSVSAVARLCFKLSRSMSDSRRGVGLDIGFIGHFNTRLVITLNYSAIANFHTLQITTAHAKSFPACSAFTRRFLVTASDSGYSPASVLKSSMNGDSLPTVCSSKSKSKSKPELLYDQRFTANQFVLVSCPLRLRPEVFFFFQLSPSGNGPYVTSSLTRRWVFQFHSLQSLCKDLVENTVSNSTSVVAWVSVAAGTFTERTSIPLPA
jgi:hypothetical protein